MDDLASPSHVESHMIAPELQSTDCWYGITPYYLHLDKDSIYKCLHFIFGTVVLANMYIERVWAAYQRYIPRGESSARDVITILHLCDELERKFGSVL